MYILPLVMYIGGLGQCVDRLLCASALELGSCQVLLADAASCARVWPAGEVGRLECAHACRVGAWGADERGGALAHRRRVAGVLQLTPWQLVTQLAPKLFCRQVIMPHVAGWTPVACGCYEEHQYGLH